MGVQEGLLLQVIHKNVPSFACDLGGVCYGRSSRLPQNICILKKKLKSKQESKWAEEQHWVNSWYLSCAPYFCLHYIPLEKQTNCWLVVLL